MAQEGYEIVQYHNTNFKFTVASVEGGPKHMHQELEISLLLDGSCRLDLMGQTLELKRGDFWIINSMRSHNIQNTGSRRALILHMQISPSYFEGYYPDMELIEFPLQILNRASLSEENYRSLILRFTEMADHYFRQTPYYQLKVAGEINLFFYQLMTMLPSKILTKEERNSITKKVQRLRELTNYIQEHFTEPLYLTDLAAQAGLSMSRLSHIFKESFGISFQEYLAQIRCQHARRLLEETNHKILDICMECGFSDPKYFNRDFRKFYNLTPREYRKAYRTSQDHQMLDVYTTSANPSSTQQMFGASVIFHSERDSLAILEYCQEIDLLKLY